MIIVDTAALDQQCSGYTPSEVYWIYNGLDCCVTLEVFETTFPQLDEVTGPIYRHDMEMVGPVIEMSLEGLPVDLSRRREVKHHYSTVLSQLEMKWARLCHEGLGIPLDRTKRKGRPPVPISISSPKDVQFLFHEILGVPEKKKRRKASGIVSATTDRDTLEGFRNYYFAEPFVNMILAQRDQMKSIGFLNSRLDPDNHLRCSFNIAGTDTGRLSSQFSDDGTGTNLQNITGKLKDIFVAPPGWMFVDVDLEQGDSRGVGAIAWNMFVESHGEEWAGKYLDACESGDLHTTVCKMAWTDLAWGNDPAGWKAVAEQIAYRDLSYRDLSKKLGHGSNYMGQPQTMAMHTKMPVGIISDFQVSYFNSFPCITAWQNEAIRQLTERRELITPWGRRRIFWNDPAKQATKNAAIAYAPQSTTGEFTNRGLLNLWHHRNQKNLPIRFLVQVHDSVVMLVRQEAIGDMVPLILKHMRVPLMLARDREFTIPHGIKVGWNYGRFDKVGNPYGLLGWKGEELRQPPRRQSTFADIMDHR